MYLHFAFYIFLFLLWGLCFSSSWAAMPTREAEAANMKVQIMEDDGTATISLEATKKFEVRIDVDPGTDSHSIPLQVELPEFGPKVWPTEDLHVVDEAGQFIPIRRNGIQWHKFDMSVPPVRASYFVRAISRDGSKTAMVHTSEEERTVQSSEEDISISICRWYGGRQTALSIRFDDSHPTHLSKAVPILREYGLKATFMINSGAGGYQSHKEQWEECAKTGVHEFANHTLHHSGAATDEEIEREVGDATKYIWSLFPQKSKLVALNRGGGTIWTTTRPFSYYLEKYHLFSVFTGSLGMDDFYGDQVGALRRNLESHIERRLWCKTHFHSIGTGLKTSEENFRAAIKLVKSYEPQLWIAGLTDVFKYQEEREASRLLLTRENPKQFVLQLLCGTDPTLYNQPLTIKLTFPGHLSPESVLIQQQGEEAVCPDAITRHDDRNVALFHVAPVDSTFVLDIVDR